MYYLRTKIRGQLVATPCKLRAAANDVKHPYIKEGKTKTVFLKQHPIDPPLSHALFLID